ncbi:hypothetical protein VCBJG01_3277 [Vibrio cholerae BJG-01]|nr:hypothetical protein VCBJG01_3277 [Vibrio cholerae BJG-01]
MMNGEHSNHGLCDGKQPICKLLLMTDKVFRNMPINYKKFNN